MTQRNSVSFAKLLSSISIKAIMMIISLSNSVNNLDADIDGSEKMLTINVIYFM